jgi:hypothetical protein
MGYKVIVTDNTVHPVALRQHLPSLVEVPCRYPSIAAKASALLCNFDFFLLRVASLTCGFPNAQNNNPVNMTACKNHSTKVSDSDPQSRLREGVGFTILCDAQFSRYYTGLNNKWCECGTLQL